MKLPICNFCGKEREQTKHKMLIGPNQLFPFICIDCISQCNTLLYVNSTNEDKIIQFDYPTEVA